MDKQTTNTIYPRKTNTYIHRKPNFSVASFQMAKRKKSPEIWQLTGEVTKPVVQHWNTRQGKKP